ncbi:complex I NDUFA9 subunit family protein [Halocynthiibacter sp. C4]|uniref:complex I NDUFA9 subunit family protein n=1 Tax=Halocynthiibacter sp. C4 TaxID=2992758 RepID=UPI00237B47D7|nr:complex I NDUFA9 subunit family protein [Halocynthiibacter sp. C4]MDE0590902.1 complex I NDUFA9 subunit family protein [Halocynthiibacter sp. C4]
MSKLVTIYGGSGFVGRYIARRMAKAGWRVRVAVRRPNEAMFVRPYGAVGQVEPVLCNIRDDASVAAVMHGADAVVNCVGILSETKRNKFDSVQHEGAERIARLAKEAGVAKLVHISAIGADENAASDYSKSKALGEQGILENFPEAVILRPSVIFGNEDEFFNRFASMSRLGPILPIFGGNTRFQPVYVDDVAEAAENAILGDATGIYELGGPEALTLHAAIEKMLGVVHRKRLVMNLPFFAGRILAGILDFVQFVSMGLIHNGVLTGDQLKSLRVDNVVSDDAKTLNDLGVTPTTMDAIMPTYLWRFRPNGQFEELRDSAKNLKA